MPELFPQKLRRLRLERELTPDVLSAKTLVGDKLGVTPQGIKQAENAAGRVPDADTIEALAGALGVVPESFYEWPIAVARRDRAASPEAARKREADALRKRAQRTRERLEGAPDTTPAPRHRKGQAR